MVSLSQTVSDVKDQRPEPTRSETSPLETYPADRTANTGDFEDID